MYKKLRFKKFKPYTKELGSEDVSCGGHLVSCVTGIPLKYIRNLHPSNEHWEFEWVSAFLRLAGFSLLEVPRNFVDRRKGFKRLIHSDHLLVFVLNIDKEECTWACAYKGKVYHGQHLFKGFSLAEVLINCPVEKMWICYPNKRKV